MKKIHTPTLSTAFSDEGKKAKSRFENILSAKKRRASFLVILLVFAMLSAELLVACNKKDTRPLWEQEQRSLTQEEATEHLREELTTAYENTYQKYSPLDKDPSPADDAEYLRYAIANLELKEEDDRFYKYSVIFEFWVEKATGDIYKYYNGLDSTLTLFDPYSTTALAFAG